MDPNVISNGFNNYFVSVGPTLASKIITDGISHRSFLTESLQTSFFLEPTTTNEIKAVISKLKMEHQGAMEFPSTWNEYQNQLHIHCQK